MSKKYLSVVMALVLSYVWLPTAEAAIPQPTVPNIFHWTNVQQWSNSLAPKVDVAWSTLQMPARNWSNYYGIGEQPLALWTDMNGDSMVDFVSVNHVNMSEAITGGTLYYTAIQDIVKINDGMGGYTVAYACYTKMDYTVNKPRYYGDCADTTSSTAPTVNPVLLTTSGNSLLQKNISLLTAGTTAIYDAAYSTLSMPNRAYDTSRMIGEMPTRNFTDINGDGLLDFMYIDHVYGSSGTTIMDVTMLNTGSGWTPVYQCAAFLNTSNVGTYYGDCVAQ